jgi:hypothetical protein
MAFTRSTVAKGAGAITIRRQVDDRLLFLNTNSKYVFSRTVAQGDKVQGFNSEGRLIDLDIASSEETYELEVSSRKNTRNINELSLDALYVAKTSYDAPWAEMATVASGSVTLKGGTPVSASTLVTYVDGGKLTLTAVTPTAAGQYKDNGDGTLTFHSGDNGKTVAIFYKTAVSNVSVQGGADYTAVGYVDVMFHQVSGSSSVGSKKGVDILWLPKCALSGDLSFEYSNAVAEKTFKLTGLIPETPAGFKVPYVIVRDVEIDNTNAG